MRIYLFLLMKKKTHEIYNAIYGLLFKQNEFKKEKKKN